MTHPFKKELSIMQTLGTANTKVQMINQYLAQQIQEANKGALQTTSLPQNQILEEFKKYARAYIEIDNAIRKLKAVLQSHNIKKKEMSNKILLYMEHNDIGDLRAPDGSRLRYKVAYDRPNPSKADIKERLAKYHGTMDLNADEFTDKIFEKGQKKKKVSLQRIFLNAVDDQDSESGDEKSS